MDEKFQDKIDNYLLNRMDDAEKAEFLREVEQDEEKKEQLEFTQNVKDAIRSREEKLQATEQFQQQYERERKTAACTKQARSKKKWLWISGVAAMLAVGFFAVKPIFNYESSPHHDGAPTEQMRGGDDVFCPAPADSTDNDTIKFNIEKVNPDE